MHYNLDCINHPIIGTDGLPANHDCEMADAVYQGEVGCYLANPSYRPIIGTPLINTNNQNNNNCEDRDTRLMPNAIIN